MNQRSLFSKPTGPKVRRVPTRSRKASFNTEIVRKIEHRQRQILVHSNLYYRQGTNLVEDHVYDRWAHELYDLIVQYPNEFKQTEWFTAFKDYDGNTGMGLPYTDPWVEGTALHLIKLFGGGIT